MGKAKAKATKAAGTTAAPRKTMERKMRERFALAGMSAAATDQAIAAMKLRAPKAPVKLILLDKANAFAEVLATCELAFGSGIGEIKAKIVRGTKHGNKLIVTAA